MESLKKIEYRGGVICFKIPAGWREEYEEAGGATFYADCPDSGTLRLNVLTFEGPALPGPSDLLRALLGKPSPPELLPSGNAMVAYQDEAKEDGEALTIYRWELANAVAPRHLRLAVFSYTVLQRQAADVSILREVALLNGELQAAAFARQAGVAGKAG